MNERILVRCVNWLGDAVMSTPALLRLREARPDAHITLLSHAKLAELWKEQPYANAVMTFTPDEGVMAVAKRLRAENFDLGIAFPNSVRSGLELRLAGIPKRVGYSSGFRNLLLNKVIPRRADAVAMHKKSDSEIKRDSGSTRRFAPPKRAHHIYDYLEIVAAVGASPEPLAPKIVVTETEVASARAKLNISKDEVLFGLNPGAEYGPAKRWLKERFAAVAAKLQMKHQGRWIIFGGAADREICDWIAEQIALFAPDKKPINVAGQTSLRELAALLKTCRLVLTNDTGPMHLANAVGAPIVVPFGSTSSELTGPIFGKSRILQSNVGCSPCFRRECPIDFRCMKSIEVGAVVDAAAGLLQ
ncbi:MAG: Lipopolysaccharide heptosyltransferase [Verrucomicrobiales bacterium]|nr:Lipopolysaccharide heptosyltransferase [Verrucomicrobiales bacterium]